MPKDTFTEVAFRKYEYETKRFNAATSSIKRRNFTRYLVGKLMGKDDTRYVTLITGDAGIGKTEFGKYLYEQTIHSGFHGIWIDWRQEREKYPERFNIEGYNVEDVFHAMYTALRDAGHGKHFREYEKISGLIDEAEQKVTQQIEALSLQEQVPDYLAKMRLFTAKTIRALVSSTILGKANALIPAQLKELADEAISQTIKAAAVSIAKARLNNKEYDVYVNGTDRLCNALAEGISKTAVNQTITIVLDHYDFLLRVDAWLRYLIHRAGPAVLWILIGKSTKPIVESFREDIRLNKQLLDIEMRALTVEEVEQVLNSHPNKKRDPSTGEVRKIYELTHGNTLVLRMLMKIWVPGEETDNSVLDISSSEYSRIVEEIFKRYLRDIPANSTDQIALGILSFCYEPDPDLVKALLSLNNINIDIEKLKEKYPYLFEHGYHLTTTAQYWLRTNLLRSCSQDDFQHIAKATTEWWLDNLKKIENATPDFAANVYSNNWRECAIAVAYHCFWQEDSTAVEYLKDIMRSLLFVPLPKLQGFLIQLHYAASPLLSQRSILASILQTYEHGIAKLVINQPSLDEARKFEIHETGILIDSKSGRVVADLGMNTFKKAIDLLNLPSSSSDPRLIAVQVLRSLLYASSGNYEGAYAALQFAHESSIKIEGQTAQFLSNAFYQLSQSIMGAGNAPLLNINGKTLRNSLDQIAVKCLTTAINLASENTTMLSSLASAYFHACDYENAISAADKALESDATNGGMYNIKANALIRLRRTNEAIEAYTQGLECEKTPLMKAILANNLGIAYIPKDIQEAERLFDLALEFDPGFSHARVNKSLLIYVRKPELALAEVQEAVRFLHYCDVSFVQNLSKALKYVDNDTAIGILQNTLAKIRQTRGGSYVQALLRYEIADRHLNKNDLTAAIEQFDSIIEIHPRSIPAYFGAAITHSRSGNARAAREYMLRVLELNYSATGTFLRSVTSMIGQNFSKDQFRRSLRKRKNSPEYAFDQAVFEIVRGEYDKAVQQLRLVVQNSDDFWPYLLLCVAEVERDHLPAAISYAEKMIIRLPEGRKGFAYYILAQLLQQQGNFEEAINTYKDAIREYELHSHLNQSIRACVWYDLALCLEQLGRTEESHNAFHTSYLCDPQSPIGRLSRIVILVSNDDFVEARLEFRRLERDTNWERELEVKVAEWKNKYMAELYETYVAYDVIKPIFQAALLIGEQDAITKIQEKLGANTQEMVNWSMPLLRLTPITWSKLLPEFSKEYLANAQETDNTEHGTTPDMPLSVDQTSDQGEKE